MRKIICLAGAVALVFATWMIGRAAAASRCVPNQRFTALSEGLVKDKLTNLVWQQSASSTTMTWAAAQTYCSSGFRLPTVRELASLVDLTIPSLEPTIDPTAFPRTPPQDFWTSTLYANDPEWAWIVSFWNGRWGYARLSYLTRVRCVR